MKVSREQAAANREQVVAVASRLLRERGIDGIGVDALMQGAGLTHGGFYKNFASMEARVAEACARALADGAARWSEYAKASPDDPVGAIIDRYLSPEHCEKVGEGCVFAALAADAGKRGDPVRTVVGGGLDKALARLASLLPGRTAARRRERAMATMAGLVGALVLARIVDDGRTREELLSATAKALKAGTGMKAT